MKKCGPQLPSSITTASLRSVTPPSCAHALWYCQRLVDTQGAIVHKPFFYSMPPYAASIFFCL